MKGILDAIERCKAAKQEDIDFLEEIEKMVRDRMENGELEEEAKIREL